MMFTICRKNKIGGHPFAPAHPAADPVKILEIKNENRIDSENSVCYTLRHGKPEPGGLPSFIRRG